MDQNRTQTDEARIRQRAYEIWMDEGAPSGREEANWLQAEAEIARAEKPAAARLDRPGDTDGASPAGRKAGR